MTIRLNWGTAVAFAYLAFASATVGVVMFAMGRPVALVRADYYAASLTEDAHLAAVRNAAALGDAASIVHAGDGSVVVTVPTEQAPAARGTVTLYRPSNAAADRTIDLAVDRDGRQRLSRDGLLPGYWRVQVRWSAAGREYDIERPVHVR